MIGITVIGLKNKTFFIKIKWESKNIGSPNYEVIISYKNILEKQGISWGETPHHGSVRYFLRDPIQGEDKRDHLTS